MPVQPPEGIMVSFCACVQVADNLPLYGVCCYMEEMVHRPPSLLKAKYPDCNMPLTRYMVAAPRCYCFLTHYPFFSLHMKVSVLIIPTGHFLRSHE